MTNNFLKENKDQLNAALNNLAIARSVRYNPRIQLTKIVYTWDHLDTTFTAKILYNKDTAEAATLTFENSKIPFIPDFFCSPDLKDEALICFASGVFLSISDYTELQPLLNEAINFYNIVRNDQKKREELGCPFE